MSRIDRIQHEDKYSIKITETHSLYFCIPIAETTHRSRFTGFDLIGKKKTTQVNTVIL